MAENQQQQFTLTGKDFYDLMTRAGADPLEAEKQFKAYMAMQNGEENLGATQKDSMPAGGRPAGNNRLYENGPFSLFDGDIISAAVPASSTLAQWIPTRAVTSRATHVQHLEYIKPKGFDGTTETYANWLRDHGVIDSCGYGPSTTWNGFRYEMTGGTFSWTTDQMKVYPDGGLKYYEQQPSYTVRGNNGIAMPLNSDKDWAVARTMFAMQQHLGYVLDYGDLTNSDMEWDGLAQVLTPGYIGSRVVGGVANWADPITVNAGAMDVQELAQTIRVVARRIIKQARQRQWTINAGDMALYMPATMWDNLVEFIAMGAMERYSNTYGFDGNMSYSDFVSMRDSIRRQGIVVDGVPIQVLTSENTGDNATTAIDGSDVPAVVGDIYILVRRAGGLTFLEQQYVDWSSLDYPAINENQFPLQGGIVRAGWVTEANKCYYYYAEMGGRLVSYMSPMQGRIMNAVVPTLGSDENIASAFYKQDWFINQS
jgi:hypothetical protein